MPPHSETNIESQLRLLTPKRLCWKWHQPNHRTGPNYQPLADYHKASQSGIPFGELWHKNSKQSTAHDLHRRHEREGGPWKPIYAFVFCPYGLGLKEMTLRVMYDFLSTIC